MKISALIASLVLGVSGVAAAAPGPAMRSPINAMHAPIETTVAYRPMQRPHRERWTLLDTQSGRAGRNVISVASEQRFSKLSLKATRGSARIDRVEVTFGNGRTQTINVNELISVGTKGATIDLSGNARQITKIVVLSKGRAMSSYQVLAA